MCKGSCSCKADLGDGGDVKLDLGLQYDKAPQNTQCGPGLAKESEFKLAFYSGRC